MRAADAAGRWDDAVAAAHLIAVDPAGLGGIALRARPGPVRERWLAALADLLPAGTPLRRMPAGIAEDRLIGGLDIAATLRAKRPVAQRGLLAECDGGVVVAAMAERMPPAIAAQLGAAIDRGEVEVARDGFADTQPARIAVVALDEGDGDDERMPVALADRLALWLYLDALSLADAPLPQARPARIAAARERLADVSVDDASLSALCAAALSLGIGSLRAPLLAVRAARAVAALAGRDATTQDDVALAARLVLAPRATMLPAEPADEVPPDEAEPPDASAGEKPESDTRAPADRPMPDRILAAAKAALPADVLARLTLAAAPARAVSDGRKGTPQRALQRGRRIGVRTGDPRRGLRLALVDTLRAAAPWQPLRRQAARGSTGIEVRKEDFRVHRFERPARTVTVFVVDASGSTALNRLAEAKGAVELLLADCYVRRDEVALVSMRGRGAELLLPPTRSLTRAKRALAGLPGGGGTPLAAGIDTAAALADSIARRGATPLLVFLTDGQANVARDGSGGRERASSDALAAARSLRAARWASLLVDTSPRPQPKSRDLAETMGARYVALPHADARALAGAVRKVAA